MALDRSILERLIEASPDIVVATDADGTIAYYNDGAHENLGYSRAEIIDRYVAMLYPSIDEARRVMQAMRSSAHGGRGRAVNLPTTLIAKDGREIPVSISGVILYDENGREQGTIGFAKDVSGVKRIERLATLGEIAIGLSHEINNPLTVIESQAALIDAFLQAQGAEAQRCRIECIRAEVRRIEANLDRLRQMSDRSEYTSSRYLGEARMIDLSVSSCACEAEGGLAGHRMLVVDDDDSVRKSVVEILSSAGAEVDQASNGREALERLRSNDFELVLSDVVMPEMDGYDLLLEIRKMRPNTHVVLMTAFYYDKDHVIKRSRLEGIEGVLFKKPIDPGKLKQSLAALLTPSAPRPSSR